MSPERTHELTPGRAGNRLLDRLPEQEYARLPPLLVSTSLALKQPLIQPDEPIHDIVFPTTALVSTIVVMGDGSEVESRIIGAEGVGGLSSPLRLDLALHRPVRQGRGGGVWLPAPALRAAAEPDRQRGSVGRPDAAVVRRQAGQAVACNALPPL